MTALCRRGVEHFIPADDLQAMLRSARKPPNAGVSLPPQAPSLEVANGRIWAGFHYRFSTRVGTEMGYQIGAYVVQSVMQPAVTGAR